jgi:hypothetical protein
VTGVGRSYLRVIAIWLLVLSALYLFQWYFS